MYQPNKKFWGKNRHPQTIKILKKWTDQLDPHEYQIATADKEDWYGGMFSICNMNDEIVWFKDQKPVSIVTLHDDGRIEIKFLIGGHEIREQSFARAIISPISSWKLGVRASKTAYNLRINRSRNIIGTYNGQRISIIAGQTLVCHPRRHIDGHLHEERLYIKESLGTVDGPKEHELCPKRNHVDEYHDYTCWFSFKKLAYQSCRYCNNLWVKEDIHEYKKIEHPPWHLMRMIKNGSIQTPFLLAMPNTEIFYDPTYDNWHYESFHGTSKHMNSAQDDKNIPDYPAVQPDQVLDTLKEIQDAINPAY